MSWYSNLVQSFQSRNVVEKFIILNILIFVLTYLFNTLSFLFQSNGNFIIEWFALGPDFDELIFKPWTLITYGFLHLGFLHILFNMIFLYYFGILFTDFFNAKQFSTYYLTGIIAGGLIYMLSYNYLPVLKTQETILVGASAGVTAIVIGISSHIPQYSLRFRFIGNIKLLYLALAMIIWDVIQIPNGNAGGHLAHLGGALVGFLMTRYFDQGRGLIAWFENVFTKSEKKPLKTVYKNKGQSAASGAKTQNDQERIDEILDKISKSGYETLSKAEKDFLFKAGKK